MIEKFFSKISIDVLKTTITFNGNGSFVSVPALPQDTEMAD
jgi:hypothetical protein